MKQRNSICLQNARKMFNFASVMRKIIITLLLCMPLIGYAQNNVNEAQKKAIEAKRVAEEAARKAEEARIAALKAEAAAKAAEAAQAQAEAEAAQKAAEEAQAEVKEVVTKPVVKDEPKKVEAKPKAKPSKKETTTDDNDEVSKWAAQSQKAAALNEASAVNYLEGAVTEENGVVTWRLSLDVDGKSADEIFERMGQIAYEMTQKEGQLDQTRIALADKAKHQLVVYFHEWLVFSQHALSLDRTEMSYVLSANCSDGHIDVIMNSINYLYEKERSGGSRFKAEKWITDKYSLNKAKTKLYPISGKFRRKTIDRKNEIFNYIKDSFNA